LHISALDWLYMAEKAAYRSKLERWLALLVSYWAYNMGLIWNQGTDWPGFGYSTEDKAKLQSIARQVPAIEYYVWLFFVVVFYLLIITAVVLAGFRGLSSALGPDNFAKLPETAFFLQLAFLMGVCLSLGMPAAMLPAAALTGRLVGAADAALPDAQTTAHFIRLLWWQLTRIALVLLAALVPLWIFVPADSKLWIFAHAVLPLLAPAVSVMTALYYFTARSRPGTP
jgi:hypothetical protein